MNKLLTMCFAIFAIALSLSAPAFAGGSESPVTVETPFKGVKLHLDPQWAGECGRPQPPQCMYTYSNEAVLGLFTLVDSKGVTFPIDKVAPQYSTWYVGVIASQICAQNVKVTPTLQASPVKYRAGDLKAQGQSNEIEMVSYRTVNVLECTSKTGDKIAKKEIIDFFVAADKNVVAIGSEWSVQSRNYSPTDDIDFVKKIFLPVVFGISI